MTVGKHWKFLCKFHLWHEEVMTCCKIEGCFILYLISTQCRVFLGLMTSCGAGTRLHTWRNASLNSRRKLDQRAILPLNQGCCQPHYTEVSLRVWQPLVSCRSSFLKESMFNIFSVPFLSHIPVLAGECGGNFTTDTSSLISPSHSFFAVLSPLSTKGSNRDLLRWEKYV